MKSFECNGKFIMFMVWKKIIAEFKVKFRVFNFCFFGFGLFFCIKYVFLWDIGFECWFGYILVIKYDCG